MLDSQYKPIKYFTLVTLESFKVDHVNKECNKNVHKIHQLIYCCHMSSYLEKS